MNNCLDQDKHHSTKQYAGSSTDLWAYINLYGGTRQDTQQMLGSTKTHTYTIFCRNHTGLLSRHRGQHKHIHNLLQTTGNETDNTGQRNKEPSMAWGRAPTGPSVIRIMGGGRGGWGEGGGLGGGPGAGEWQGALGRAGRPPNNTCCIGVWTNHLLRVRGVVLGSDTRSPNFTKQFIWGKGRYHHKPHKTDSAMNSLSYIILSTEGVTCR